MIVYINIFVLCPASESSYWKIFSLACSQANSGPKRVGIL